jgi:L-ribulose-5-phosphate 3-epimerase
MSQQDPVIDRRRFLQWTGAAALASATARHARASDKSPDRRFKKAVKLSMVKEGDSLHDKFQLLRDLGFDGVDIDGPADHDGDALVAARDKTGLVIHGVVCGALWRKRLSDPDPAVRAAGREVLERALRTAQQVGATTVLVIPAVVTRDVPYADAYKRSQAQLRRMLPVAAELGVVMAVENVWNHFLLSPLEMARFVDEIDSPFLRVYFDCGNCVYDGWPDHWIRILGPRIAKLDIKEYSRAKCKNEGMWKGFDVPLGEGDVGWPAVLKALRDVGYAGWGTAEIPGGDRKRLADIAARMDRVFAS